jgi:hypothetical protein
MYRVESLLCVSKRNCCSVKKKRKVRGKNEDADGFSGFKT